MNVKLLKKKKCKPLISIIIAVYNGEKFLESTIKSIINQTYSNFELIIIDGGSNDQTLNIIEKYSSKITYWVSEKDNGISDAFNKGVLASTGDYINFQGDGDGFCATDSLEQAMFDIDEHRDVFISCQIQRTSEDGNLLYISKYTKKFRKGTLLFRMSLPHQGLFTHRKYFDKYGLFDVNNTYCMDYEHLLRSYHEMPYVKVQSVTLAKWRADGLGNNRDLEIFREYHKIKVDNQIAAYPVLIAINFWTLFKYAIKKVIK